MTTRAWLNTDQQLVPGTELFRSDRRFSVEAYSASHSQLLLRSLEGNDGLGNHHETTIDLLFKPTDAIKIETGLLGLTVRCAPTDVAEEIKRTLPSIGDSPDNRVFLLDSQGVTGYVISAAVGWREGVLGRTGRGFFNSADIYDPRWPTQPLFGVNPGFNEASAQELIDALTAPNQARRERFRTVYVLMTRVELHDGPDISGAGVFLTQEDAEDAQAQLAPKVTDCWIEALSIAL